MTFVAAPPSSGRTPRTGNIVDGDGWYPDLEIEAFRQAVRLGTVVTEIRAREALLLGLVSVADALAAWRTAQEDAGIRALELVEDR